MRNGKQLIGKNVVAVDSGAEIDRVKDLLLDRANKRVVGFLVDKGGFLNGAWLGFHEAKVLPLANVHSFGDDAVMVASASAIQEAAAFPAFKSMLEHHSRLEGTSLMTSEGREIGTVHDVQFNEQTGDIVAFEVSKGVLSDSISGRALVPVFEEVLVGENVVIVNEDFSRTAESTGNSGDFFSGITANDSLLQEASRHDRSEAEVKGMLHTAGDYVRSGVAYAEETAQEFFTGAKEVPKELANLALHAIEEFRVSRAVGGHVDQDVRAPDNQVVLHAGEPVTPEAIAQARNAGALEDLLQATCHAAHPGGPSPGASGAAQSGDGKPAAAAGPAAHSQA